MGGTVFFWKICSTDAGLQESTLSSHRMTTGFGPFIRILTRSWANKHTDSRCRLILLGHLRGLFSGRYSCTENSFAGHSGLYWDDSLSKCISLCVRCSRHGSVLLLVMVRCPRNGMLMLVVACALL